MLEDLLLQVLFQEILHLQQQVHPLPCQAIGVDYQHAGVIYYTEATDSTTQSGGVSATATAHITTAISVLGAKGTHSLSYSGYTWTDISISGSNPSNAVRP